MLKEGIKLQNRYSVGKRVGQGGMGSVYLATDERFNSTVAIKETLFTNDSYRKAFSREARLLNSLKHSALPKVSDTFVEGNGQYIVMEFISGEDLFEMLESSGEAFPIEDVLIWAEQLLDALEYLHGQENPVIHRDIKPQNLKLTPQGQVILLDFGLAKGNPTDANHQTAANSIFGYSRNYASLEQIQGTGTDPRSDIYSLAATLYHLLTGKPPADALTRVMLVLNEENDPLQSANLIHEQVPEELANYLREAMSLNANLRPQSASEMRELLSGKRKTVVSTKPNTAANKAAGTNLYTQNTKVFEDGEKPFSNPKQSDIKTEILTNDAILNESVKTKTSKPITLSDKRESTRHSAVLTQDSSSKNKLFAVAAACILFLVGSVASMVYMFSPEGVQEANPETQALIENNSVVDDTNSNSDDENIFADGNTNLNSDFPDNEVTLEPIDVEPITSETIEVPIYPLTSEKDTTKKTKKHNEIRTGKGETKITNGTIRTKNATVSDGRVETKSVVIDGKGMTTTKSPKTKIKLPKGLPITPEQYEGLTPEQQEKVRTALEKKRRADEQLRRMEIDKQRRIEREKRRRNRRPPTRPPSF